jgi:hypothetical protein
VRQVAAGVLLIAATALGGGSAVWFAEFLGAGDDPWTRLAIVPAFVALTCAVGLGLAAFLVWRDRTWSWIGATALTVVLGVAWIDFGMGTSEGVLPFLLLPSFVIAAMLALCLARLLRPPPARI